MISMMFETPMAPAASVPTPTIHIRSLIPVKRPWILSYSSSRLKCPMPRLSCGETLWRARRISRTFSSTTEAGTPSTEVTAIQCDPVGGVERLLEGRERDEDRLGVAVAVVAALAGAEEADDLEVDAVDPDRPGRSDPPSGSKSTSWTRVPMTATLRFSSTSS